MSAAPQVVTTANTAPLTLAFTGVGTTNTTAAPAVSDRVGNPPIDPAAGVFWFEPTHGRIAVRALTSDNTGGGAAGTAATIVVELWNRLKPEAWNKAYWTCRRVFTINVAAGGTRPTVTNELGVATGMLWASSMSLTSDVSTGPAPTVTNAVGDVAVCEFDRRAAELVVFRIAASATESANIVIEQINAG